MTLEILAQEKVWLDKSNYVDAERVYFEKQTKTIKYETFEKYINDQVKSLNNNNCKDCSMCSIIAQIDSHSDISKLLDKVQQWDEKKSTINLNQYQQIKQFECLVCCFKTFKFNDWKCHIMSLSHMADCHRINNLYSYVCFEKICKLLLYGPKESLIKHNMDKHSFDIIVCSMSSLMAEVMKRYLADNLKPLYFCSHCKKFAETPVHTDIKLIKKGLKIPIEYYCRFCRVTFLSSQEMIDYHLLSVEHMTIKCFYELCLEAKINTKKIKLSEELNQSNEDNLSGDVQNVLTTNQAKLPNIILTTINKYYDAQVKPQDITNCKDCSMCSIIAQIDLHSDISKLLDKVQQWDEKKSTINLNQYQQIKQFECLVCCFTTFKFNDWKCHIMSLSHMADCHRINNLYSYVCFEKICKLLLYGPKDSLIKHNMDTHSNISNVFSMSTLMAEVMKRYLADNLKPLYFCSHCKKFAETPVHTDIKLIKKGLKIPIEYYCRFCRVKFLSSQEMIDYHLLTVEHMTLKCFDELCSEATINLKHIKLSEESNKNNENNLSDVQNTLTTNSIKLPYIILTRFQKANEYCGLCKLCSASLIWDSKIIVSHLLECKYTYDSTDSNKITVNTFDCNICNHSTNSMNQHQLHIMSHSHLTNCYDTNNYYSYFCDVCNRYMYSYRLVILKHSRLCHKDLKTTEFPILSMFMASVFKELNKNASRIKFKHYHSTNGPIEVCKTDSFQCNACKVTFDMFTDYNWHLITSEHIILSFVTPKAVKRNEKIKNLSPTNIQTIESSIVQNVPLSQKYDIKSEGTQNVQLNKSQTNHDVNGRILLDSTQKVQKSLVNNNVLDKLNAGAQRGSNKSIEYMKSTPNPSKHRQQYSNYFKHKMILLKKLRQYDDLVVKTLSYYCDVCDFIAVEKYVWDKHNKKEHPVVRPITYCSTCFMFVIGENNQEHNRSIEHCSLLNFLQASKLVEVIKEKTSLVKLVESCSSDKNCINLSKIEKKELNNTDCFKEFKYSNFNNSINSDCSLMEEPSSNREDPMFVKNTILLLDKTKGRYEHKNDDTNAGNTARLIHSEITTSSNNLVNSLMTIPNQANVPVEKTTENINLVNASTDDLVENQVENGSKFIEIVKSRNKVLSNFDETTMPPLTNNTQIFEKQKISKLDEDQLYGEYVIQRLKNIKNTTIKQHVKLEIDFIFYTKMKQLSQENTK